MVNILLVCAYGMSTSLLVNKMKEVSEKTGFDCSIEANPVDAAADKKGEVDIVLVGPQVRFMYDRVKRDFDGTPVLLIDSVAYGTMNGAKVIEQVKQELNLN